MPNPHRKMVDNARIDLRTRSQKKRYFELAAFLGGYNSLSNFMVSASEKLAQTVLEEAKVRVLSNRDRDLLIKYLKDAPNPIPELSEAYQKISKLSQKNEKNELVYQVDDLLLSKNKDQKE